MIFKEIFNFWFGLENSTHPNALVPTLLLSKPGWKVEPLMFPFGESSGTPGCFLCQQKCWQIPGWEVWSNHETPIPSPFFNQYSECRALTLEVTSGEAVGQMPKILGSFFLYLQPPTLLETFLWFIYWALDKVLTGKPFPYWKRIWNHWLDILVHSATAR